LLQFAGWHVVSHRARRRFSQNFLIDRNYIERLGEVIAASAHDHLLEIGPGMGALTAPLLRAGGQVDAIEIDRDAVRTLEARFAGQSLKVHCGDVLEFDFCALGSDLRVVGNLPYHISTPILFAVDRFRHCVKDCHFMLQREVVERMAAVPASAEYGRLSVMLQSHWQIQHLFDVPPTVFRPQPKVWSAVVRMQPTQAVDVVDGGLFYRIVEAAFAKRRKTLRNALRELVASEDFAACGVEPGRRGETLSVAEFANLTNQVRLRLNASSE
jgi:16S rRNA (adenine1518-N6/adenine1519-N6)-dimethyltransferase